MSWGSLWDSCIQPLKTWKTKPFETHPFVFLVRRCPTSTWKRPPSSPCSRRNWPSSRVKQILIITFAQVGGTADVFSVIGCFPVCNFASFRGERPAQWSDPEHPAQLRSDQHGRAQRHTGLPAQHSQVRSHQNDARHCVFVFIYLFFPFCFLFFVFKPTWLAWYLHIQAS